MGRPQVLVITRVTRILEIPEFPYNMHGKDKTTVASVSKSVSFHSAVSIERRLVTDRQTDRQRVIAYAALCICVPYIDIKWSILKTLKTLNKSSAVVEVGDRLATIDMG